MIAKYIGGKTYVMLNTQEIAEKLHEAKIKKNIQSMIYNPETQEVKILKKGFIFPITSYHHISDFIEISRPATEQDLLKLFIVHQYDKYKQAQKCIKNTTLLSKKLNNNIDELTRLFIIVLSF